MVDRQKLGPVGVTGSARCKMVQEPGNVRRGSPVEMFAVIAKFKFCSITTFGIELVVASFVCVGGEMRTLVVKFFDGRGARGAEYVKSQEFPWGYDL